LKGLSRWREPTEAEAAFFDVDEGQQVVEIFHMSFAARGDVALQVPHLRAVLFRSCFG